MKKVYTSTDQLDFELSDIETMPVPGKILMVKPTHYTVEYVINPHMSANVGNVDKMQAENEWEHLSEAYEALGYDVHVLDGVEGLPDMVFSANQSLPYIDPDGNPKAVMSIMGTPERAGEVPHIQSWLEKQGYEILHLDEERAGVFEGMGDAMWHFRRRLLWGGYGFRSSPESYEQIAEMLGLPVILLKLKDEKFYHLDTCFSVLNDHAVMIYPDAFTENGLELIRSLFDTVIETTSYEAEKLFAVNACCPDGRNVLIQQGCTDANKKLRDAGFSVHEFSTYEFIKAGGSVFCLKLLLW
jgi:N-dimethylarginine dimethylaminohydrolase